MRRCALRGVCLMWGTGSSGFSFEIIIFLAEGNQPYSVEINHFFLGRTFYRLRLVSNLNGTVGQLLFVPGKS